MLLEKDDHDYVISPSPSNPVCIPDSGILKLGAVDCVGSLLWAVKLHHLAEGSTSFVLRGSYFTGYNLVGRRPSNRYERKVPNVGERDERLDESVLKLIPQVIPGVISCKIEESWIDEGVVTDSSGDYVRRSVRDIGFEIDPSASPWVELRDAVLSKRNHELTSYVSDYCRQRNVRKITLDSCGLTCDYVKRYRLNRLKPHREFLSLNRLEKDKNLSCSSRYLEDYVPLAGDDLLVLALSLCKRDGFKPVRVVVRRTGDEWHGFRRKLCSVELAAGFKANFLEHDKRWRSLDFTWVDNWASIRLSPSNPVCIPDSGILKLGAVDCVESLLWAVKLHHLAEGSTSFVLRGNERLDESVLELIPQVIPGVISCKIEESWIDEGVVTDSSGDYVRRSVRDIGFEIDPSASLWVELRGAVLSKRDHKLTLYVSNHCAHWESIALSPYGVCDRDGSSWTPYPDDYVPLTGDGLLVLALSLCKWDRRRSIEARTRRLTDSYGCNAWSLECVIVGQKLPKTKFLDV